MNIYSIILICVFSLVVISVLNITNQQHKVILFLVCLVLAMLFSILCSFVKQSNKLNSEQKIQFIKKLKNDLNQPTNHPF